MSFLRWFFTDKCPNCKGRLSPGAKFCSACGWGNEKSWRNCTSCGRSVGAESNYCWGCKADLRMQPRDQVVSDCWRREPGVAAIRITIETPEERLRNGIQVDGDTRGVFLRNGVIATDASGPVEIGSGYHTSTSFMQRLFGSGPTGNIEAMIVTASPVEVRVDASSAHGLRTSDHFPLEAAALIKVRIEDLALFQRTFMPRGKELVRDDELGAPVIARVIEVLRRFASQQTSDALISNPDIRSAIEAELGTHLPRLLAEAGLAFHMVVDLRFGGEALERKQQHLTHGATAQMEAAAAELQQKLDHATRTRTLISDDEFQETIDRIAHERCLTTLEREHLVNMRREYIRRDETMAKAHTDGQVRDVRVDYELNEQRKRLALEAERKRLRIQLEREEDEKDLDTLAVMRRNQLETLAALKRMKVESQVNLAQGLHGLDPLAQIAGAGASMAPHMVTALQAMQPQPQVYFMPQTGAVPVANAAPTGQGQRLEDIVPRYLPAVGLVLRQFPGGQIERIGTAWIAQGRGVLVTNAHVASDVDPRLGVQSWVVFPGTNGKSYPVTSVEIHPEYTRQLSATHVDSAVLTHDVAIIRLESMPPHAGVPVAPKHKLLALRELQTVGYVGYPMGGLAGGGTSSDRPQPVAQAGRISALTNWQQQETTNLADRFLIRHSLGVAKGASGSPLFDEDGNVIGIVCGMNAVTIHNPETREFTETPNAAMVNFAQRIDVLGGLVPWF